MNGVVRTSEVTRDMVALSTCCSAILPLACQAQVARGFPAYVVIAKMVVKGLGIRKDLVTGDPLAWVTRGGVVGRGTG